MDLNEIWCIKNIWKIASYIGINPPFELTKRKKIIYYIVQILFLLLFPFYFSVSLLIYPITTENIMIVFENVPVSLTALLQSYKDFTIFIFRLELQKIRDLLLIVKEENQDQDEINYLTNIVKFCDRIFKISGIFLFIGITIKEISIFLNTDEKKIYYYKWHPKIISSTKIGWNFIKIQDRISAFYYLLSFQIVETFNPIYLYILTGHFHVLLMKVNKISKNSDIKPYEELLKCLKYYKMLQRVFKIIEKVVSWQLLIQYIASGSSLAILGLTVGFVNHLYSQLIVLIITQLLFISQIFLSSYFADMLKSESDKLTNAIFSCNWVEQDKKFRKTLIIFMARSQKSFEINTGWLQVKLESFAKVLNFAYSTFLLLKQMQDNAKII